mmetsp:Transcript_77228/g.89887  ORF Transcript_77228/g.89887 Transcript_77228/m.89887 type:complete len:270 (+) Transcript_77228:1482-2291(+)
MWKYAILGGGSPTQTTQTNIPPQCALLSLLYITLSFSRFCFWFCLFVCSFSFCSYTLSRARCSRHNVCSLMNRIPFLGNEIENSQSQRWDFHCVNERARTIKSRKQKTTPKMREEMCRLVSLSGGCFWCVFFFLFFFLRSITMIHAKLLVFHAPATTRKRKKKCVGQKQTNIKISFVLGIQTEQTVTPREPLFKEKEGVCSVLCAVVDEVRSSVSQKRKFRDEKKHCLFGFSLIFFFLMSVIETRSRRPQIQREKKKQASKKYVEPGLT